MIKAASVLFVIFFSEIPDDIPISDNIYIDFVLNDNCGSSSSSTTNVENYTPLSFIVPLLTLS